MSVPAEEGLRRLQAGNSRFRQDPSEDGLSGERLTRFLDLSTGQQPFAAVLGCSDSRVPVEVIFDQGPGQLFVVRVAGHVVGPAQLSSLEFAVETLGIRLLMVLGHTDCRAVAASLDLQHGSGAGMVPHALAPITRRISMTLDRSRRGEHTENESPSDEVERIHARAVASELVLQSNVLASAVRSGQLLVAGSMYDLKTGQVNVFEGVGIRSQ